MICGTVTGSITADAKSYRGPNGKDVVKFTLASHRCLPGGNESTDFVRCEVRRAWGQDVLGDLCKSQGILAFGELSTFRHRDDGTADFGMTVEKIEFLDRRDNA